MKEYQIAEIVTPYSYEEEEKELKNTPQHVQYWKGKYPDAVILFRCGDFYESYCQDAQTLNKVVEVPVTRMKGKNAYNIAKFPYYALDTYLPKLIRAGKRVAICDQIEEPKKKTITETFTK